MGAGPSLCSHLLAPVDVGLPMVATRPRLGSRRHLSEQHRVQHAEGSETEN